MRADKANLFSQEMRSFYLMLGVMGNLGGIKTPPGVSPDGVFLLVVAVGIDGDNPNRQR